MNDHRAAGQELQSQVMAAARKGQQRAQKTVRQMTSAAQQIRPHLASLPKPHMSSMPGQSQFRQRAPELASKLHARLPSTLQSRVPSPDQVKSSAQQFAGHARSVQRSVVSQVRHAASPLAQQAASKLSQFGSPEDRPESAGSETTTKVSQVSVKGDKAKDSPPSGSNSGGSNTGGSNSGGSNSGGSNSGGSTSGGSNSGSKAGTQAKPGNRGSASGSSSTSKPRTKPAGK